MINAKATILGTAAMCVLATSSAGCFPYFHKSRVPGVGDEAIERIQADHSGSEALVLVLWRQETLRWSKSDIPRPCILAPPEILEIDRLGDLHKEAKEYWDYGVQAFDQHAGTKVRRRDPWAIFVISRQGYTWLLLSDARGRKAWTIGAEARLGEQWKNHLSEQVSQCDELAQASDNCGIEDSIFDQTVGTQCDIQVELTAKSRKRLVEFVSQIDTMSNGDPQEVWSRSNVDRDSPMESRRREM